MMLNHLLSGFFGTVRTAEADLRQQVELRIGQIVSGTVLKLLANQEALVNIGGITVRARLEAPLSQGQRTLLQVQPESTGDTIVLKPLQTASARIAEATLGDLLASFRAADTEANRRLLLYLHAAGIPLGKNVFRQFRQIAEARPAGIPEQQWLDAAIAAERKGLPLTRETVAALRQALFGGSLTARLSDLNKAITRFLESGAGNRADGSGLQELARQLKEAIRLVLQTAAAQGGKEGAVPKESAPPAQPAAAPQDGGAAASARRSDAQANSAVRTEGSGRMPAGDAGQSPAPRNAGGDLPAGAAGVQARSSGELAASAGRNTAAAETAPPRAPAAAQTEFIRDAAAGRQEPQPAPAPREAESRPARPEYAGPDRMVAGAPAGDAKGGNWINALLKQIGLDYEHRLAEQFAAAQRDAAPAADAAARHGSVKALLLAILDSQELPQALKDSAQEALQHITGQQLLLGGERGMPLTTVTLFIPVQQDAGSETAAVHVQARKKRGGLDPDNCRILFDLRMQAMGDTLIDVQVVDRMVSLQVYNDHAGTGEVLAQLKPDIQAGLSAIGYQCISLKHLPYPSPQEEEGAAEAPPAKSVQPSVAELFTAMPYKGVDIRV